MANWSESESDYKTRCPYCSSYVVATLTIVRKQVRIWAVQSADGTVCVVVNVWQIFCSTYVHTSLTHTHAEVALL